MGIGIRTIRSFVPQVLAAPEQVVEEVPATPPSRPARRKAAEVPVMQEDVLGVRHKDFSHLPPEVWNHVVAAVRDGLRSLCRTIDETYASGIEQSLVPLLDQGVPNAVYSLGRDVMQGVLSRERGFLGSKLACDECDETLEFEGDKRRSFQTRLGEVTVYRSYYHCSRGHTVFPLDILLGIQEHAALPAIQEEVAFLASSLPYAKAVAVIQRLLPVKISNETAQRVTATVAAQIQTEQDADRRQAFADPTEAHFPDPATAPSNPVAVVAADGGMCRIRDQEAFSEFKVGVLGTVDPSAATPEDPAPVEGKHYVAHFADADTFFEYLAVEYHRLGLHLCPVLHMLGDGAVWLWSRGAALRQEGQEYIPTLDFFHAAEHVADLARALFGPETTEAGTWSKAMRDLLYEEALDDFFAELEQRRQRAVDEGATSHTETVQAELDYFAARRDMLNYKQCRERGLPIGSGMVEGGIRFVGKDRLHCTGMRWHVPGAEAILQLRSTEASKEKDAFSERQATKRLQAYQAEKTAWLRAA